MLAPVTLRRTSPKSRATSTTSSQPIAERFSNPASMVWPSGALPVVDTLLLGGNHFAAGQCPDFKDALEAKLRLVVGLLYGRLCFRMNDGPVRLFRFTHVDLIATPTAKLVWRNCSAGCRSIFAMFR